jgi:hypothetical protein
MRVRTRVVFPGCSCLPIRIPGSGRTRLSETERPPAEVYNPDGSTFTTTIKHKLNPPKGIETTMIGGAFDGARFTHSYTPTGGRTKVDLEGDFPAFPGMSEADELKMIDGFFTMVFAEDMATLRSWS